MCSQIHAEPTNCYGNASDALVGRTMFNENVAGQCMSRSRASLIQTCVRSWSLGTGFFSSGIAPQIAVDYIHVFYEKTLCI